LKRADAFLLTRCSLVSADAVGEIDRFLQKSHPAKPVYHCDHQLTGLWNPPLNETTPMNTLAGKKVFLTAGIGDPLTFAKQVTSFGCAVVGTRWFDDHKDFSPGDIAALSVQAKTLAADCLITTEKDWVKLKTHWPADAAILVAKLAIEFRGDDGSDLLSQIAKSI
jgi:tetraacyldisaccharide 4'-kinase